VRPAVSAIALVLAGCGGALPMPSADPFSTWSRTPLPPSQELATLALERESCLGGLQGEPALTIVLQDRRTESTAAFFVTGPDIFGSCVVSASGAGGGTWTNEMPTLTGVVTVDEMGHGTTGTSTTDTLGGLVAQNVALVKVGLRDATEVIATVDNGYWLSWWPGGEPAQVVRAIDTDGVIVGVLDRQGDSWVSRGPNQ
jgi:hypothetical protein